MSVAESDNAASKTDGVGTEGVTVNPAKNQNLI